MKIIITEKQERSLKRLIEIGPVEPSKSAMRNICNSEKFCNEQGEITFGQLRALVESTARKRLYQHVGEGGFKATIRMIPWFLPQLIIAGAIGSAMRSINKIIRPTLEETSNYKTWWGRAVMKSFDIAEGELGLSDPLSKIFFISDGLMTMMDNKYKVKFAKYIAELASDQPDEQVVPEYFVENELRKWVNDKFLLDPPLPPKI